jgi:hypothetical protein
MSSRISKAVASRIPLELYFPLVEEAKAKGYNLNDYLCKIIYEREIYLNNKINLDEIEFKRREALNKLANHLSEKYGLNPEVIIRFWNANF